MSNWKEVTLKDISTISGEYGIGASATDYNPDKPRYLRITDIDDNGRLNFTDIKGFEGEDYSQYILHENDIVFARTGNTTGKNYIYNSRDGELVFAGFLVRFRINPLIANSRFIKYCVNTKQYWDWVKINSQRSGQPGINGKEYGKYSFSIPPLKEQQKIAEILSSVDAAIEKTEQVIAKTEEVKKGLMQQLLTKGIGHTEFKQTTIGEIPVEWEAIKAKDIFSNVSIKNNYNEELLSVTQENGVVPRKDLESRVTMPEGSVKSYKLVVPGDFIISLRSFQGGLELSKIRGIVSPAYTILQSQIEIDEEYFKYFFKSMWFINRLNSAVIGIRDGKQISYSVFSDLYFPIPPLNEQRRISNILNNIDKRLDIEKGYLNQQQQIKQGLMQQLLTGKTRVKID